MERFVAQKVMSVLLTLVLVLGIGMFGTLIQAASDAQPAFAAQAGAWKKSSGKWWYSYSDGEYAKSGWQEIDGTWYLFDGSGWMKTGWQKSGGKWYYLANSGAMKTGWQKINGAWYYLKPSGAMATGWQKVGGFWYHLKSSGVMSASTWVGNYYVDSSGVMQTDKWIDGYYVGSDGKWDSNANLNSESSETVYWVIGGKVYHLSKNCSTLKKSSNIHSGSIAESGKSRACKVCG